MTLGDAGEYITALPEAEHAAPEWQAAIEALILNATIGGHTLLARVGVLRALNRHVERVFDPWRKEPHWGRLRIARPLGYVMFACLARHVLRVRSCAEFLRPIFLFNFQMHRTT